MTELQSASPPDDRDSAAVLPPEGSAPFTWHWLERGGKRARFWMGSCAWWTAYARVTPEHLHSIGWTYVCPVQEPVMEGGDG